MRTAFLALGIVASVGLRGIQAQSEGDAAAYAAMVSTPVAALSPVVLPYMTGTAQGGLGFAAKYGRMSLGDLGSVNTLVADFTGAAGKGSWGLEVGYLGTTCEGCTGNVMAGLHLEEPLAASGSKTGTLFTLGMQGTIGFAKPTDATAWAAGVTLPVALSVAAGRAQIVPFVSPGVGVGLVSVGGSHTGYRFDVGGGVGVTNVAPGLGLTVGAQKVLIDGGRTVFGLGVSWTPLR
jgi:hypothetical protein